MRLIYLSPVPWASFEQRPHRFVEWFHARTDEPVLWVEPYATRLPGLRDYLRLRGKDAHLVDDRERAWLRVLQPVALPIEPFPASGIINRLIWIGLFGLLDEFVRQHEVLIAVGKPSALALQVVARYGQARSLYDAMDYFPAFYKGWSRMMMARRQDRLAQRVDRIIASATALANHFSAYKNKLSLVRNACETRGIPPARVPDRKGRRIVLGYIGTVGRWFDWPLVIELASRRPDVEVLIVGPVFAGPQRRLPANITLEPPCANKDAIGVMQQFDVGLIPFLQNELTACVDPIKYYEYRALGLPVISTRFGEMALRDEEPGVFIIDQMTDARQALEAALGYRCRLEDVVAMRASNSWEVRFDSLGLF